MIYEQKEVTLITIHRLCEFINTKIITYGDSELLDYFSMYFGLSCFKARDSYNEILNKFEKICLNELETINDDIVEMYFTEQFQDLKFLYNEVLRIESIILNSNLNLPSVFISGSGSGIITKEDLILSVIGEKLRINLIKGK